MTKAKRSYTPEEVIKMIGNVFIMGELTGFLDSISMHPEVPETAQTMAAEKVQQLRTIIKELG